MTLDPKHIAALIAYAVLTSILNLIFSKRSQIDEWCEANPKLAAFSKFLRGVGVDPWTLAQSLVLLFTSKLPGYQKQSLVELKAKKAPGTPPLAIMVICAAVLVGGCAFFRDAVWPIVAKCAPSPSSLLAQVEAILLAGGDYQAALLEAGKQTTKEAIVCAVRELTDKWGKPGAAANEGPQVAAAYARGKAFLAETGNQ